MRWGSGQAGESGQATVEWVGLVLGVALALAALVAGGREATDRESATGLGEAVAERITCAARDLCGAGGERRRLRPPASREERPPVLRGVRPQPLRGVPPQRSAGTRALRPLRGATGLVRRAWLVCLGYRRWRYEVEHPMTPRQAVPVRETLKIVNECVNPLSFFFG